MTAQTAGTFATNDMVGIREDLADVIYNVAPTEVPFQSLASFVEATNTLHEWQTDTLATAASNSVIEGAGAPATAGTASTRLNNRTQIATKDARVSGTGQAVDTAGRADELDYQVMKRAKELKRDLEVGLLNNVAKVTGNDTLAAKSAGIVTWIATNTSAIGADPAGTGSNTATNGTQRVFTEDLLKEVIQQTFISGGDPDVIMVGAFNKQKVSGFTGGSTHTQKAEDKVLHASFDVYESDFGQMKVVPNRFMTVRDALVLQSDLWSIAFLPGRNMQTFDLARVGDSDAKQVLCEYSLQSSNEAGSGIVRDITSS